MANKGVATDMAIANPERGEVGLVVVRGDEEKEYVLKLSINAAVAMQKKLGKPLTEVVNDLQKLDVAVIREMAFMFLQKHHKDEIKTVDLAGDVIDDAGGIGKFLGAFQQLVAANNPDDGTGKAANPPTAQATTTGDSTLPPDVTH
jgi:hypothetical protein